MPSNARNLSRLLGSSTTVSSAKLAPEVNQSITSAITLAEAPPTQSIDTSENLPLTGNDIGDQAYVEETGRMYIWTGSGWYNIALINQNPAFDSGASPEASYELDSANGTPTIITLLATDPEELPITYSAIPSDSAQYFADITQVDNQFTITAKETSIIEQYDSAGGTFSVTFKASDGVNLATALSEFSITLTFVSPYWKDVVLLTGTNDTNGLQNDSFVDRSTNGYTITPSGSPTQTAFHPYLDNWSVEFDGTGDLLNLSSNIVLGGDFTISAWIYLRGSAPGQIIANIGPYGSAPNNQVKIDASNRIGLYDGSSELTSTGTISRNNWHFIEVTRSGASITFYIDGTSSGTATTSASFTLGSIGALWQTADLFNGYISNLRVTTSSISNSTVPKKSLTAVSNTVLLTCQSNRFIDNSSSALTLTPLGDSKISAFNPLGQTSEYAVGENKGSGFFDGTNDYLLPGITTSIGTNDFTLEGWFYFEDVTSDTTFFDLRTSGNWGIFSFLGSNQTVVYYNGSASVGQTTNTVTANEWNHIAIVRESGSVKIYINGVLGSTTSDTTSWTIASSPRIGSNKGNVNYVDGYISDVRLINGTAVYTSNFTPPTSPVGNTNALLYLPMDNAGIFDQSGNQTLTLAGNVQTSTTQTKYATASMYFDGNGDYVETNIPALGTGDFTIEGWVYFNTISDQYIFDFRETSTGTTQPALDIQNDWRYISDNAYVITSGVVPSANTWYHFAIVRSGTTTTLYVNGSSIGSATDTRDYVSNQTGNIGVFRGKSLNFFNGYLEDFQILKGVAKYTSNFTPPTAPIRG